MLLPNSYQKKNIIDLKFDVVNGMRKEVGTQLGNSWKSVFEDDIIYSEKNWNVDFPDFRG